MSKQEEHPCQFCGAPSEGIYVWKDGMINVGCESCLREVDRRAKQERTAEEQVNG